MKTSFTEKQLRAVNEEGRSLLVSAAAGSGKTSVLTARIARIIAAGGSFDDIFVATYTSAAASEMKTRIARELHGRSSAHCAEQAEAVLCANIGTFHSLCRRIIAENYDEAGISHNFRVMGDREIKAVRAQALTELFGELYEEKSESFARLLKRYARRGKKEYIADIITRIHDFIMSKPEPYEWLSGVSGQSLEEYTALCGGADSAREDYERTMPDIAELSGITRRFGEIYARIKREKNALDYDDMLHFALNILKKRELRFKYVFVDEYQDTNPVCEEIIKRISTPEGLFMVGDIKQSIYRFNLADPKIFLEKAQSFKNSDSVIAMNENFRSSAAVVGAVNGIMERVMTPEVGEIYYDGDERLVCRSAEGGEAAALLFEGGDKEERDGGEAAMVADKILDTVGKTAVIKGEFREIDFGDIAVLVRSRSAFVQRLKEELAAKGIPAFFDMEERADTPETALFVNMLKAVNNPLMDIPLLGVMRSFLGGFSDNDLARMRIADREAGVYGMLVSCAAQEDELGQRAAAFLKRLNYFRRCALGMEMNAFVQKLAEETGLATYVSLRRDGREDMLCALLSLVKELSASEDSLCGIIAALDGIKKEQGCYVLIRDGGGGNAVKVMTMHRSKGLEFPVVFLCELDKMFNFRDVFSNNPAVIHSQFGIMINYVDTDKNVKRPTAARNKAVETLKSEYRSEELRLLYVAMTRARNMLYLCAGIKSREAKEKRWEQFSCGEKSYGEATSMLDFVMGTNGEDILPVYWNEEATPFGAVEASVDFEAINAKLPAAKREMITLPAAFRAPAKLSVSSVSESGEAVLREVKSEGEGGGAKLGTLVHAVMEKIDHEKENCEMAAARLLKSEIITKEEYDEITANSALVDGFFETETAARMKKAHSIKKELPFNIIMDGEELGYESGAEVMLQGVIDLAFWEDGGWVIVDYKTDRINASNRERIIKGYEKQLALYARALSAVTGERVREKYLCFLRSGEAVSV